MKKLLALVLALVMSMSLVTISNAAFKDADKISNKEAVDVMAAVGVLAGYDNGEFGATDTLTRAQAAKIVAYLDLGKDVAEALPAVKVFSDVPASHWAAKYVAYCADAGYVSGVGDGKFDPDAKVTGYQFGKMLLCALGYDQKIEEMTGASWEIKVAKLMEKNSIAKGTDKLGSAALTREEAAQYGLNALKATMVEYDEKGSTITAGDVTIVTGAKKATPVVPTKDASTNVDDVKYNNVNDHEQQLCEKLYKGKLTLLAGSPDGFGRATKVWKYDNKTAATVVSDADLTYTAKKSTSTSSNITAVKNDLIAKGVTFTTSSTTFTTAVTAGNITVNGNSTGSGITNVEGLMALTANGKQVEIFVDSDAHAITNIAIIEFTVGQVTDIKEGKKNAAGSVYTQYVIKAISADASDATGSTETKAVFTEAKNEEDDTISVFAGIAEDAIVTYAKDSNGKVFVYPTTTITGKQSAYTSSAMTIEGTSYKAAFGVKDNGGNVAVADFPNSDKTANYYLDQFGYVVKTNAVSAAKEYAVLVDVAALAGVGASTEAKLLFQDGSTKVVTLDKLYVDGSSTATALGTVTATGTKANYVGAIYTYTVNDDGSYVLKEAMLTGDPTDHKAVPTTYSTAAAFMTRNVPGTAGSFVVTNKTIVVVATTVDGKAAYTAYTGYAAMPTITVASGESLKYDYVTDSNGVVTFVYVDATGIASVTDESATSVYVYVTEADTKTVLIGSTNYNVSKVNDYKGATEITTSAAVGSTGLYKVSTENSKGVVTLTAATPKFTDLTVSYDAANGVLSLSDGYNYTYDGSETVIVIDSDKSVSSGSVSSVVAAETAHVYVSVKSGAAAGTYPIDTLYVVLN